MWKENLRTREDQPSAELLLNSLNSRRGVDAVATEMSVWVGGRTGEGRPPVTTATMLSTNTSMESGIEAGVLPTVTGSLASARDSLGSLSRAAEPMYDTDHTDLGSELDEAEIRRELMHDVSIKWLRASTSIRAFFHVFNLYTY